MVFILISTASYLKPVKRGLIKSLLFRCFNLCLNFVNILKSILCKNNYPRDFDDKFASNSHKVRMCENWVSALTGKRVKGDSDSVIKEHHLFRNYSSSFDDFSKLASNNNDFKVTLMESLLINRDLPPFNRNRHLLLLEVNNIVNFGNISHLFIMSLPYICWVAPYQFIDVKITLAITNRCTEILVK